MVVQNTFTEFFEQWGRIGTTVAWGNNLERVIIKQIICENNEKRVIIFVVSSGMETYVSVNELYPLFCEVCHYHSFMGLVRCEGCEHRQCPKCMDKYDNNCGSGC